MNVQLSAGYYLYNWMPFNKVTNYTIANPKPTGWTNHNTYYVTVRDSLNCFSVTDTIHVNANTAGVTVVENNASFKVYPNPTNGVLHINSAQSGTLTIRDLAGKEVAAYSIKEGIQDINLSGKLSSGHYLGHFIGKDQTQLVIKLEYER